jgi:hypothetical protein
MSVKEFDMHRGRPGVPPIGRFSHKRSPTSLQTSISLQDGCFGMATLMRISALVIPSSKPGAEEAPSGRADERSAVETLPPAEAGDPLPPIGASPRVKGYESAADVLEGSGRTATGTTESPIRPASEAPPTGTGSCSGVSPPEVAGASDSTRETGFSGTSLGKEGSTIGQNGGPGDDPYISGAPSGALRKAAAIAEAAAAELEVTEIPQVKGDAPETATSEEGYRDETDEEGLTGSSQMGEESKKQPIDHADKLSIEIIRCRAVCPDWRDVGGPDESPMGRPDTLVLGIPHLLLQFPPSDPAQHPDCHLVQVIRC